MPSSCSLRSRTTGVIPMLTFAFAIFPGIMVLQLGF